MGLWLPVALFFFLLTRHDHPYLLTTCRRICDTTKSQDNVRWSLRCLPKTSPENSQLLPVNLEVTIPPKNLSLLGQCNQIYQTMLSQRFLGSGYQCSTLHWLISTTGKPTVDAWSVANDKHRGSWPYQASSTAELDTLRKSFSKRCLLFHSCILIKICLLFSDVNPIPSEWVTVHFTQCCLKGANWENASQTSNNMTTI